MHESVTLGSFNLCGVTYNTHNTTTFSFLQKKAIPSFPLKACTSSNAGEIWTAQGGPQVNFVWVCQNNKWIPYE